MCCQTFYFHCCENGGKKAATIIPIWNRRRIFVVWIRHLDNSLIFHRLFQRKHYPKNRIFSSSPLIAMAELKKICSSIHVHSTIIHSFKPKQLFFILIFSAVNNPLKNPTPSISQFLLLVLRKSQRQIWKEKFVCLSWLMTVR